MRHKKISSLLNEASNSKFVTRKWNIVNNQWNANYAVENTTIDSTETLKSNLWQFNNVYILVRGYLTILEVIDSTQVTFKFFALFTKCISKIDGTTIDGAEDLYLVKYLDLAVES